MDRLKIVIVVEAIPPHCGGGEQVAWIHAVELARFHDVSVVTLGAIYAEFERESVHVFQLPRSSRNLLSYLTFRRPLLNDCIDKISPDVIHCHMPNELAVCLSKKNRLMVSTIHDGVPEDEQLQLRFASRRQWARFKIIRRVNVRKSDIITSVSRHNCETMCRLYPRQASKFSFIPNPIYERFLDPVTNLDDGYVLNFGRQISLKVGNLLEAAKIMTGTRFVFVGTGDMVSDYGLPNVDFVGFSESVEEYIDRATLCVFPSLSENFPLVGLEAMARGKAVIASKRGFSEYIDHMENGYLLESTDPDSITRAITLLLEDDDLRNKLARRGRVTAENFRPARVIDQYLDLYKRSLDRTCSNSNA